MRHYTRIHKIEIKPTNIESKVIISSKMYDEKNDKKMSVKITFDSVAVIDFRINLFECMIGAEAFGLYCVKDKAFVEFIAKSNYDWRKEVFLMEGDYNFDEGDENDILNCFDICGKFKESMDDYSVYIQNVEAGPV